MSDHEDKRDKDDTSLEISGSSGKDYGFAAVVKAYKGMYTAYQDFSLRDKVKGVRLSVNDKLERIPKSLIPLEDEHLYDVIQRPIYNWSELCNREFPYFAMLCRSHGSLLVCAATIIVSYPFRRAGKKMFLGSALSTLAVTQLGVSVTNYKWYFPHHKVSPNSDK